MSAEYPGALWFRARNYTRGRNGHSVRVIINHIAQGTDLDGWFTRDSRNTSSSSHFGIYQDGSVRQYVRLSDTAWANGIDFSDGYNAYKSNLSYWWVKWCWDNWVNPNYVTISIEHQGFSGQPITEAQYQASLKLNFWLATKLGLPIDTQHITGHYVIDSVNRPYCPGSTFPWQRLYTDLYKRKEMLEEYQRRVAELEQRLANARALADQAVNYLDGQAAFLNALSGVWKMPIGEAMAGNAKPTWDHVASITGDFMTKLRQLRATLG